MVVTLLLNQLDGITEAQRLLSQAGAALLVGFAVSTAVGALLIRRFGQRGVTEDVSQPDSERLDTLRRSKRGTPTMGGLMIIAGVFVAWLLCGRVSNGTSLLAVAVLLAFGLLGLVDDALKLNRGAVGVGRVLSRKRKLAVELVVGLGVAFLLYRLAPAEARGVLAVPFVQGGVSLGAYYWLLGGVIIALITNSVNLTDGLDGLAAGCTTLAAVVPTTAALVVALTGGGGLVAPGAAVALAPLGAGLIGALIGFLRYNRHPAKIFMGDTGALAIGGLLGVVVVVLKLEVLFLLFGLVFVVEAGSVMLQVASFKLTRRRIFRCAPFHHHLEFGGWSETKVTSWFWLISTLTAGVSVVVVALGS